MSILKLIKKVRSYNNKADAKLIKKAYTFAYNAHKGKKRASGEDYITHPLHVALLLADFHLDEKAISAALLHDVGWAISGKKHHIHSMRLIEGAQTTMVDYPTKCLIAQIARHRVSWINCAPNAFYPLVEEAEDLQQLQSVSLKVDS